MYICAILCGIDQFSFINFIYPLTDDTGHTAQ